MYSILLPRHSLNLLSQHPVKEDKKPSCQLYVMCIVTGGYYSMEQCSIKVCYIGNTKVLPSTLRSASSPVSSIFSTKEGEPGIQCYVRDVGWRSVIIACGRV